VKTGRRATLVRLAITLAASAIIFLLVRAFVAGTGSLTIGLGKHEITLLSPSWFYLLALVPYVFFVVGETLSDLSIGQLILSCVVRSALIAGVALALARPSVVTDDSKVATVVLVDVSASITDEQLAKAQAYVDQVVAARKDDDKVFVVSFARHPRLLSADEDGKVPRLGRHAGEEAASDLQSALQLAYGLYPPGYLPRAVVVSDGLETSGDLLAEAYKARDFGVRVSWQSFDAQHPKEIRVAGLHLPEEIKVGAPFEVRADIWSTHEEEISLSLRQDDFPNGLEPHKTVRLHPGMNRVAFKSEAKAAGFTTYTLTMKPPAEDAEKANNQAVMTGPVKGRPRVLYVEGEYERQPQVASYFARAMARENIDVEVRGARGMPSTARELERYDLVLLSDVGQQFMGLAQMQALESYVRDLGGGFIMSGGEDSFGSGGYQGTRIEKLLPVKFDGEKDRSQPSLALVLVMDRSGSMFDDGKLEAAKQSAIATAEVLEASDLISVITFDQQAYTIVRLQRAANRMAIATAISRITADGGTNVLPGLQEAYRALAPVPAKRKHVIVMTDGQASHDGIADLCREMIAARITVSSVGIGDFDRTLLEMIAQSGEGRFYEARSVADLPRIFVKETLEVQKSQLVEDQVKAVVAKRADLIEGTGVESAPYLHGYVSTKAKQGADVILISDERGEPLLASWRVGTGQVAAWTSDLKNRWGAEWLTWPGYQKFWAQLVRTVMRHKQYQSYDLSATVVAGVARVAVDAVNREDRFVNDLDTTLQIIDPRTGKVERELAMDQTAAGRYEAEFAVDRYGSYLLKAIHRRGGTQVAESSGAVSLPYPAEYLRSTPELRSLEQAATITGGMGRPAPAQLYDRQGQKITFVKDLWPYVLLGVALAFVLDVFLRRVRLFGYRAIRF
jgi:Ca-activated chloride channel family protein